MLKQMDEIWILAFSLLEQVKNLCVSSELAKSCQCL